MSISCFIERNHQMKGEKSRFTLVIYMGCINFVWRFSW